MRKSSDRPPGHENVAAQKAAILASEKYKAQAAKFENLKELMEMTGGDVDYASLWADPEVAILDVETKAVLEEMYGANTEAQGEAIGSEEVEAGSEEPTLEPEPASGTEAKVSAADQLAPQTEAKEAGKKRLAREFLNYQISHDGINNKLILVEKVHRADVGETTEPQKIELPLEVAERLMRDPDFANEITAFCGDIRKVLDGLTEDDKGKKVKARTIMFDPTEGPVTSVKWKYGGAPVNRVEVESVPENLRKMREEDPRGYFKTKEFQNWLGPALQKERNRIISEGLAATYGSDKDVEPSHVELMDSADNTEPSTGGEEVAVIPQEYSEENRHITETEAFQNADSTLFVPAIELGQQMGAIPVEQAIGHLWASEAFLELPTEVQVALREKYGAAEEKMVDAAEPVQPADADTSDTEQKHVDSQVVPAHDSEPPAQAPHESIPPATPEPEPTPEPEQKKELVPLTPEKIKEDIAVRVGNAKANFEHMYDMSDPEQQREFAERLFQSASILTRDEYEGARYTDFADAVDTEVKKEVFVIVYAEHAKLAESGFSTDTAGRVVVKITNPETQGSFSEALEGLMAEALPEDESATVAIRRMAAVLEKRFVRGEDIKGARYDTDAKEIILNDIEKTLTFIRDVYKRMMLKRKR